MKYAATVLVWWCMIVMILIDDACYSCHRYSYMLYMLYMTSIYWCPLHLLSINEAAYNRFGIYPCYVHCIRLHHILLITSCCIACMSSTPALFPIRVMHTSTWWTMFTSLWYGPMIHNPSTCHWCMMQALLPFIDVYSVIDITQYMIYKMHIVHTVNCYCMVHLSSIYGTCQRWYCILRMLSIHNASLA